MSRWWLPGMNRAAGEKPALPAGRRVALHHMITAGDRGYAAWRDGGFTIHDISDPAKPRLLSHINWSPPFPGGTHTPLPLPGRNLAVVVDEANAEKCAKGTFYTFIVDVRAPENPVPISTLPTPTDRDYCSAGVFGPHNLHENRPGSFRSEETIFATYNNAGVRVFDIRDAFAPKEIASWVPPVPQKLIDPRPNVGLAAKTCDCYVTTEGLMYVSDWNGGMHVLQVRRMTTDYSPTTVVALVASSAGVLRAPLGIALRVEKVSNRVLPKLALPPEAKPFEQPLRPQIARIGPGEHPVHRELRERVLQHGPNGLGRIALTLMGRRERESKLDLA